MTQKFNTHTEFAEYLASVDWATQPIEFFSQSFGQALTLGMLDTAQHLATVAHERFPDDSYFKKMQRLFDPAPARLTGPGRDRGIAASRKWVAAHANKYRGQWVAVARGEFLSANPSLRAVRLAIQDDPRHENVVLFWIPADPTNEPILHSTDAEKQRAS